MRLAFIDNIRWTMILLVLSMHASDTYSPFGSWYYTDRGEPGFGTIITFALYQTFLQAFFMALLFFIAGYFAAPAFDRKGPLRFSRDRFVRLGLPTLLYMLLIGPLTQYFLSRTWGSGGFGHQWLVHLRDGEWLSETGPMWFCAALLALSLVYALVRGARPAAEQDGSDRTDSRTILAFIAGMALATFVVRVFVPETISVLNMHPGDFPQYVLMFAAGIAVRRGGWFERLPQRLAARWALGTLLLSVPLLAVLIVSGGALHHDTTQYSGGFNLVSAGKCLWESLVCVGMSSGPHRALPPALQPAGPVGKIPLRQCVRRLPVPPAGDHCARHPASSGDGTASPQGGVADGLRRRRDLRAVGVGVPPASRPEPNSIGSAEPSA